MMSAINLDEFIAAGTHKLTDNPGFQLEYTKVAIAATVMKAREAQGLSQAALAKKAALPLATVVKIEKGSNTIIETLSRIASALGKTLQITVK
ncbi:helix-turn-helix domain-containing protein [Lentilactobacillus sp. TOM.63]|uniref:helix-turn-helix domain-containing protein n=1 Tax=Lentilactobacillus sp. TOM.63 TaxID=3055077 RepID=UPI0025A20D4B|nr:helix-turn-helix domain-containing protein [Lentilactobacillus sp. TOM.63]MDM7517761.1 helix-turn-helix domain-containing protein [Lentilactobacillus sp. TOM.63]